MSNEGSTSKSIALKKLFSEPYFGDQQEVPGAYRYADTPLEFQAIIGSHGRWETCTVRKQTELWYTLEGIETTLNPHRLVNHIDNALKTTGHAFVLFRPNTNSTGLGVIFSKEIKEKRCDLNSLRILIWGGTFSCDQESIILVNDIDDLLNRTGKLVREK
jgi:hypothetical protein